MPSIEQKKNPRAGKRGRRIRTDGRPRLLGPGAPGNPHRKHWAIAYIERRDGRSRSRVFTTHETEETRARDALIIFNAERARPPEQRDITVKKICDDYMAAKEAEALSFKSLQSALRPIIEELGPLMPSEVLPANLSNYVTERLKAPKRRGGRGGVVNEVAGTLSKKTVSNELRMFKTACNWAKEEGWNFDVPPFKKQKKTAAVRKRTLSRAETGRIFYALRDPGSPAHLRVFAMIGMLTGQRSGAIRALKWEHVDFEEGMIWFTRAKPNAPNNKRIQDHPMTAYLDEELREAFTKAQEQRQRAADRGHPVAPMEYVVEHKQRPVGSLKTAWAALLLRAGVDGVWIHDLRRTAATIARNSGSSNADVALYLNDSEEITKRTYAHASPALLRDMQTAIAAIIVEETDAAGKRSR